MESTLKRTWAEIDLDALAHNYGRLRQHIGPKVRFLGVVKADAYGHGAVQVARTLQELGADYLAVNTREPARDAPVTTLMADSSLSTSLTLLSSLPPVTKSARYSTMGVWGVMG